MDDVPTYKPGDTIRMELGLSDESGVSDVYARFVHVEASGGGGEREFVSLTGDGEGKTEANVLMSGTAGSGVLAGEYRCLELGAKDRLGNTKWHSPDIRFRIDAPPSDSEGPDISGWRFSE